MYDGKPTKTQTVKEHSTEIALSAHKFSMQDEAPAFCERYSNTLMFHNETTMCKILRISMLGIIW